MTLLELAAKVHQTDMDEHRHACHSAPRQNCAPGMKWAQERLDPKQEPGNKGHATRELDH